MTQCTVYVYDDQLTALVSNFIEILEYDAFGKKLDIQVGATLGPNEFGAKINLPNPPEPIVVWVDDTSSHFAPTSLAFLNGKETARLDVTLYTIPVLPGDGGGDGPRGGAVWSYDQEEAVQPLDVIARHINEQVESDVWSNTEALGVRSLVEATVRAISLPELEPDMQQKLSRWKERLKSLGIRIASEQQLAQPRALTAG